MGVTRYYCDFAYLGGDVAAADVAITVEHDRIASVEPRASRGAGDVALPGLTLPGFANTHSHAFHRALRGRVGRLLWINPAATMPGYRPLATGIQAALPHVSDHLPVSDLPSLQRALATGRFGGGPFPAPQPVPPL